MTRLIHKYFRILQHILKNRFTECYIPASIASRLIYKTCTLWLNDFRLKAKSQKYCWKTAMICTFKGCFSTWDQVSQYWLSLLNDDDTLVASQKFIRGSEFLNLVVLIFGLDVSHLIIPVRLLMKVILNKFLQQRFLRTW